MPATFKKEALPCTWIPVQDRLSLPEYASKPGLRTGTLYPQRTAVAVDAAVARVVEVFVVKLPPGHSWRRRKLDHRWQIFGGLDAG